MKQVQFTFQDDKKLEEELRKLRQWARSNFCSKVLIQICTEIPDRERIGHVCETIERLMPEALYAGRLSARCLNILPPMWKCCSIRCRLIHRRMLCKCWRLQ